MGAIKTTKLDNGTIGLEIIYGGKDAPFSGIDTSAPPPYIDPTGFTDTSGFLIVDGVLVASGWFPLDVVLGGWTPDMTYLDSGHFYQDGNYWNWSLAYTSVATPPTSSDPGKVDITYTIWTWQGLNPGVVPVTSTLVVTQAAVPVGGTNASAAIELIGPPATGDVPANQAASFWVSFNNNTMTQSAGQWVYPGDTPATIASNAIAFFNSDPPVNTVATFSIDPGDPAKIIVTPLVSGTAGNSPTLTLQSWIQLVPANHGTCPSAVITQQFSGGTEPSNGPYGIPPNPVAWTCVGETLYIGGYGTMILQYTQKHGFPEFSICTNYLGAICLGKFNSQLIAAGIVPGPGTSIDSPEMVLAWSAPNEFTVWNPVRGDGTVTGAGFNQISDISDYLTGIIINPGTAVILRTQGIDYITPLSGGITPFDFSHISNALQGEGCQHFKLVTEYDQIGAFIGNTNVFQFAGSLMPIGAKIRNLMLTRATVTSFKNRDCASGPFTEPKTSQVLSIFILDNILFTYNYNNKTWMPYYLASPGSSVFDIEWLVRDVIPADRPQEYVNYCPVLTTEDATTGAPDYWRLRPLVQDTAFPFATDCYVSFVQEEVSFGRDITIESAYISIAGTPGLRIDFWVSAKLHAVLVLPSTADPNVFSNYQIWFTVDSPTRDDKTTVQSPQLSVQVPKTLVTLGSLSSFKISKIALFGSFDPNQRPV